VSYNLEYSWSFIFVELVPYVIILVSLLVLSTVRLVRRRKEKKLVKILEQELLQSEITEVAAVEAFGSLDSPVVVANESFFDTEDLEDNE
jgi:hypothetical protein